MKDGLKDIVGKVIKEVVVGKNDQRDPANQVFLVFEDGTMFEVWGPLFSCAGGVDRGGVEEATDYIERAGGKVTQVHPVGGLVSTRKLFP